MKNTIINAKATPAMKEALRVVAFNKRTTSSAYIVHLLENDAAVQNELKKQKTNEGRKRILAD